MNKKPVVIDTDIGDDIDDTWAVVQALNSDDFDIKLITTAFGNTKKRAKIIAKLLTIAERTDIDIGIGIPTNSIPIGPGSQKNWTKGFKLQSYVGRVHQEGVKALVEIIDRYCKEEQKITLICIGPLTNIHAALQLDPTITHKVDKLVIMAGVLHRNKSEYNIEKDMSAAKAVFCGEWNITLIPLNVTEKVFLDETRFSEMKKKSSSKLSIALLENNNHWASGSMITRYLKANPGDKEMIKSSVLHDSVAVYAAGINRDFLKFEKKFIQIDDKGKTIVSDQGKEIEVCLEFNHRENLLDHLLNLFIK